MLYLLHLLNVYGWDVFVFVFAATFQQDCVNMYVVCAQSQLKSSIL